MRKQKHPLGLWIALGSIAVVTVVAVLYGQGKFNFGALNLQPAKKVAQVASTTCPNGSIKQDIFCIFDLEPLDYYVIKDGDSFVVYGPTVEKLFRDNSWNLKDGTTMKGDGYSVSKSGFVPMTLTYKIRIKNGQKAPSFVFDYATAQSIQGSRFIEIELPNSTKLRFDAFNIPDKNLNNR